MRAVKTLRLVVLICWWLVVSAQAYAEHWVMGRFESWSIYQAGYTLGDVPHKQLSHLVYSGLWVQSNGQLAVVDEWAELGFRVSQPANLVGIPGNLRQLSALKRDHPSLQIVLAIGGFSRSHHFANVLADPERQALLIADILTNIDNYEVDGVEIDWRYPRPQLLGSAAEPGDWALLHAFLVELRHALDAHEQQLGRPLILGASLPADLSSLGEWPVHRLAESVDYLAPITYQMHGSWETVVRAPSALFADTNAPVAQQTVAGALDGYLARGVPANKLILVMAPQAMGWQLPVGATPMLFQTAASPMRGSWEVDEQVSGRLVWSDLSARLRNPRWQISYLSELGIHQAVNTLDQQIMLFEGPESVADKVFFARSRQLLGVAMAEMHGDKGASPSLVGVLLQSLGSKNYWRFQLRQWWASYQTWVYWILLAILTASLASLLIALAYHRKQRLDLMAHIARQTKLSSELQLLQQLSHRQAMLVERLKVEQHLDLGALVPDYRQLTQALMSLQSKLPQTEPIEQSPVALQPLNPIALLASVLFTSRSRQPVPTSTDFLSQTLVLADPLLLAELYNIWLLILADQSCLIESIEGKRQAQRLQLSFACGRIHFNHPDDLRRLTRIRRLARLQSIQIRIHQEAEHTFLRLWVPLVQAAQVLSQLANGNTLQQQAQQQAQSRLAAIAPSPLPAAVDHLHTAVADQAQALAPAASAVLRFEPSANPEQMLKQLLAQIPELGLASASIIHAGETLAQVGRASDDFAAEPVIIDDSLSNYQLKAFARQPLTQNQLDMLRAFISQVAMIRRSVSSLLNDGPLLNDLYQVVSRRDSLVYVQAEKGYAVLQEQADSKRKPKQACVITLRLRVIKLYVDDEQLLQIHRSFLVAPQFVLRALRPSKNRLELVTPLGNLPVGRNYAPRIQQDFPHWFDGDI